MGWAAGWALGWAVGWSVHPGDAPGGQVIDAADDRELALGDALGEDGAAGDAVLAVADDSAPWHAHEAAVAERIVIGEASLLVLTLRHADGGVEQLRTTDEHPFHRLEEGGWGEARGVALDERDELTDAGGVWVRADELAPGDRLSTLGGSAEVIALGFTAERVPVYNLSIPAAPTYFVGEHGVWTHNCLVWRAITARIKGLPRGKQDYVHIVPTDADVRRLFDELTAGLDVQPGPGPGYLQLRTLDGGSILFRPTSKTGGAALDVAYPGGTSLRVHRM